MNEYVIIAFLIGIALGYVSRRGSSSNEATNRRMERKLDLLLEKAGVSYDPLKNLPDVVINYIRAGRDIDAIKEYRRSTGVDLKEAKDTIDEAKRQLNL